MKCDNDIGNNHQLIIIIELEYFRKRQKFIQTLFQLTNYKLKINTLNSRSHGP